MKSNQFVNLSINVIIFFAKTIVISSLFNLIVKHRPHTIMIFIARLPTWQKILIHHIVIQSLQDFQVDDRVRLLACIHISYIIDIHISFIYHISYLISYHMIYSLVDFQLGDRVRRLACIHLFHVSCVDNWLRENR